MISAIIPDNEADRLRALRDYAVLDTPAEEAFDDLTKLASLICDVPMAAVSLVDADRQWFKSSVGMPVTQTSRDVAFCAHAILGDDLMVVPDAAADPRFVGNPLVDGPTRVRFYAGAPLVNPDGLAVGALCVIDHVARELTPAQADGLRALGRQVVGQLRLRRAAADLAASERFAHATLDAMTARVAVLDGDGRIVATNRAWRESADGTGVAGGGAVGSDYLAGCAAMTPDAAPTGLTAADGTAVAVGLRDVLAGRREAFSMEYAHPVAAVSGGAGVARWSVVRASRFAGDGPVRVVVCHEDVTDRHTAAEQLRHDSRHDALTGLPNRVLFAERVDRAVVAAGRTGHGYAVLFLDLDRFKIINDGLGHAAGDHLLTVVADRLRAAAAADLDPAAAVTVARMGGDEFTLLIEHPSDAADVVRVAARLAEQVLAAVARPVVYDGQELNVTASVGIVVPADPAAAAAKDLLRDADAAMYKAKALGKARYVVFDHAMHAEVVERMHLEASLRVALDRGEFRLDYQPIVSLATGAVAGFEALVRWFRDGKVVSPGDFIPVAEDTGLIVPLGEWVLRQACRQLARWRASGPPLSDLYVTVNVSRRQLADPGLIATVQQVLGETGLPPAAVGLEITESAIMSDPDQAYQTLARLKAETGVRLAVDDFGTGYSSLACLRRFPIDLLKIDRAFVRNVADDTGDAAVMRTIVALARDLRMAVVAEGIETPGQAAFLTAAGCGLSQGYLFSRPLAAADAERFARSTLAPSAAARAA